MPRLPKPGGDNDKWAHLLNEFLMVAHNPDGTPRKEAMNALAVGTVGLRDLRTTNLPTDPPIKTPILSNNGTELVWRSINEINVLEFGAKGDGVTDDTDAIQAAIDAVGDGGNIHIPKGTFMVRGLKIKRLVSGLLVVHGGALGWYALAGRYPL